MSKIWFLGEALIDFVPRQIEGESGFLPRCGGSPYNAAVAAARQGGDVGFLGALSNDLFGDKLRDYLVAEGVDVSQAVRSDDPTTLAFVDLDGAEPRYAFFNRQSSTQLIAPDSKKFVHGPHDYLHVGSIALIDNPGANNILRFVQDVAEDLLVCLDPNARPSMTEDVTDWRARQQALLDCATIVKISQDDLAFLYPQMSPEDFAQSQLEDGRALVVITRGEAGAEAFTQSGHARAQIVDGPLVDNVGAGDTVTGVLLTSLAAQGLHSAARISALGATELQAVLARAMAAAALNCAKAGCNPPTAQQVDDALSASPASN